MIILEFVDIHIPIVWVECDAPWESPTGMAPITVFVAGFMTETVSVPMFVTIQKPVVWVEGDIKGLVPTGKGSGGNAVFVAAGLLPRRCC